MDIARIFDLSTSARFPAEEQDNASVQVLAALLQREDVTAELEKAAAEWRLAHSLFDKEPDALPLYSDLDILLEAAKIAARLTKLAVEGGNTELEEQAERNRANAEGYAACVLDGLKRAACND